MYTFGQKSQNRNVHFYRQPESIPRFLQSWLWNVPRISVKPRIFAKRDHLTHQWLKRWVQFEKLPAQFLKAMGFAERPIPENQNRFQGFFHGLLAVEEHIFQKGGSAARSKDAPRKSRAALWSYARVSSTRAPSDGIEKPAFSKNRPRQ